MATSLYKAQEAMKICEVHEHKELSCFCKTCKKFICISCGQTTHHGHDWDLIGSVAKERRVETPKLCQKIKKENLPKCMKKFLGIRKVVVKERDEDFKELEEKRVTLINLINRLIDEQKRKRNRVVTKIIEMEKKLDYLENITVSLDSNIGAYNDFDLLEMEQEMLKTLQEVESYEVDRAVSVGKFVSGEIDEGLIERMIGGMQGTKVDDDVGVEEVITFKEFDNVIDNIAPISNTQAWVDDYSSGCELKLLSLSNVKAKNRTVASYRYFIAHRNGDLILTDCDKQVIRRVSSNGKDSVIANSKPLYPSCISMTHTDDILVSLGDDGDTYQLQPSSRRLVQRMALTGKVIHTYEIREDGISRLFTLPGRTAENGNSDICVINRTSDDNGELIVLHRDGRMCFTYRGQAGSELDPTCVVCDPKSNIIISNFANKSLHLLSLDGTFLKYLLSDMFDNPMIVALYQGCSLWIGLMDGTVKVYRYKA